jgi:hypothetical protein
MHNPPAGLGSSVWPSGRPDQGAFAALVDAFSARLRDLQTIALLRVDGAARARAVCARLGDQGVTGLVRCRVHAGALRAGPGST